MAQKINPQLAIGHLNPKQAVLYNLYNLYNLYKRLILIIDTIDILNCKKALNLPLSIAK